MRVVFHGENAATFSPGFATLAGPGVEIAVVSDTLGGSGEHDAFVQADVIIGNRFHAALPRPERLRLYQAPAAGTDAIDLAAIPRAAVVCNCFGHEDAIAEYVMAALLQHVVPLADADRRLREGDWAYWAGAPQRAHAEISGSTLGILGFGHIGKAVATRARAFGLTVHVANRSSVAGHPLVDRAYGLADLPAFWGSADWFVVTVALNAETEGMVDAAAFAAMRDSAVLINVARGSVVQEQALYEALRNRRIGGAVIDTWYRYPGPGQTHGAPSALPFAELPNVVMTPHMSGWTTGTIRRRQGTMAENVRRCVLGQPCLNIVRPAMSIG